MGLRLFFLPNFPGATFIQGGTFIPDSRVNNQVGMLGDMFLWLVANLKQGVIYFIKQALPSNKSAGSVWDPSIVQSNYWL